MKKYMLVLAMMLILSGCSAATQKAACSLQSGNNTVTITEGRDFSSDKNGEITSVKQTYQIVSEEPDVLVIYKEYYERQLSEYLTDEKVKTSITETETGLLVSLEFDVKNISASSKTHLMELLDSDTLNAETVLLKMKESGFNCGDEEETEEKKEAESE